MTDHVLRRTGDENRTRRSVLAALGAAGAFSVAGCVEEPSSGADQGGSGDGGSDEDGRTDSPHDVFQLGAGSSVPPWRHGRERSAGFVHVLSEHSDRPWMIEDPESVDGLEDWYEATEFGEEVLVYVASAAPDGCERRLRIDAIDHDSDGIRGEARVSEPPDADVACPAVETYPAALVRVPTGEPVEDARFELTDGWGETTTVESGTPVIEADRLDGSVRPDDDPATVPDPLECDEPDLERHHARRAVDWGDLEREEWAGGLALRVVDPSPLRLERGDRLEIELWSLGPATVTTGNRTKYSLELYTDDGWEEIRWSPTDAPIVYTDEALIHPPGPAFQWSFAFDEEGILEADPHGDVVDLCGGLPAGRYRFAFWGAPGEEPLAVAFDLVD